MPRKVEKRTGWTWYVAYQDGDDPVEEMIVSAMTIEQAVQEAHYSLSGSVLIGVEPDYVILGARREDLKMERD